MTKRQEKAAIKKALDSGDYVIPIHDFPARVAHGRVLSRLEHSVPGPEQPVEHRTAGETGEMGLGREGPVLPLSAAYLRPGSGGAGNVGTGERGVQAFEDRHSAVGTDDLEQPHDVPRRAYDLIRCGRSRSRTCKPAEEMNSTWLRSTITGQLELASMALSSSGAVSSSSSPRTTMT